MAKQAMVAKASPEKHYLQTELEILSKKDEFWRFLQLGSLDGVWYWDLEDPQHEWMSPEFWKTLGIDPATKAHDPAEWQSLIHEEDLPIAIANFERHCVDPSHPYDQLVRYRHADGSTVWVRCRGLAIRDDDGKPIRMLGAHNDVTALKQAEERALRDRIAADLANEDLWTFAYAMSHDLKSPTNTLRMLLHESRHALKEGNLDDVDDLLGKAIQTNDSMRKLVDDLLDYTQVVGAQETLKPVDLNQIISEVTKLMVSDLAETDGEIIVDPMEPILGIAWQLKRMVQNLLGNGIKFRRPGVQPIIKVSQSLVGTDTMCLSISDNGIGIPKQDQSRVFELFSKLHRPSEFQGSGLGLALCARVAATHGTRIAIASDVGRGTTFSINFTRSRT